MKTWLLMSLSCLTLTVLGDESDAFERYHRAKRVRRIIGGDTVREGEWPYLAHLTGKIPKRTWWFLNLSYQYYYCGGSIINNRWILTAAHCFKDPDAPAKVMTPKHWHVKGGEIDRTHDLGDSLKDLAGQAFGRDDWRLWYVHAEKIFVHPEYTTRGNWRNDIALLKLDRDLPTGDSDPNIGPVPLPAGGDTSWPEAGTECYMKGWGCDTNGGPLMQYAKAVDLAAQSSSVCSSFYSSIGDSRVCAGYNMENKGICSGDSGGPLVCDKGAEGWVQAGLASFTSSSRPGDVPGVFTRISYFRDWIDRTIADN